MACVMGSINRPEDAQKSASADTVAPSSTRSGTAEDARHLSVSSRQRIRSQMESDIEAFLARGGKIEHLDITMSAEKLNH